MYLGLFVKYVLFFRCLLNSNFLERFSGNIQSSDFVKIRRVGTELFHADGQTLMKLLFPFRDFANAAKNQSLIAVRGNRAQNVEFFFIAKCSGTENNFLAFVLCRAEPFLRS